MVCYNWPCMFQVGETYICYFLLNEEAVLICQYFHEPLEVLPIVTDLLGVSYHNQSLFIRQFNITFGYDLIL